jgi:hypothetical protein
VPVGLGDDEAHREEVDVAVYAVCSLSTTSCADRDVLASASRAFSESTSGKGPRRPASRFGISPASFSIQFATWLIMALYVQPDGVISDSAERPRRFRARRNGRQPSRILPRRSPGRFGTLAKISSRWSA